MIVVWFLVFQIFQVSCRSSAFLVHKGIGGPGYQFCLWSIAYQPIHDACQSLATLSSHASDAIQPCSKPHPTGYQINMHLCNPADLELQRTIKAYDISYTSPGFLELQLTILTLSA